MLRAYREMQLLAPTTVIHFSPALLLHDMKSIFLKTAGAGRHLFLNTLYMRYGRMPKTVRGGFSFNVSFAKRKRKKKHNKTNITKWAGNRRTFIVPFS